MPEAILTPRATLKWPSRHKHRVYCDIEEGLLNIDGDENSNSRGGRRTGRGVRLTKGTVRQVFLSWWRVKLPLFCEAAGVALAFA